MNRSIILLALFSLIIYSCHREDGNQEIIIDNVTTYKPWIWKYKVYSNENNSSIKPRLLGNWDFDQFSIVIKKIDDAPVSLVALNMEDGSVLWEWSDFFNQDIVLTNGRFFLVNNNVLHWKSSDKQYWIDIQTGETIQKFQGNFSFSYKMQNLGSTYFNHGIEYDETNDLSTQVIYSGDFYEIEPQIVLRPKVDIAQTLTNRASDITSSIPFTHENDTLLIVTWQQVHENWEFQSYLGLYNLSNEKWLYDSIEVYDQDRKGVLYQPMKRFEESVIMNVGTSIVSFDIYTGEKNWETEFDHDFSFAGFEIADGIIVASCENVKLYGIDPLSGNIFWETDGAGTASDLENRIMNGVVYFGGGSSGVIHAVDIRNGKSLWKLIPDRYGRSSWNWSITVAPSTDGNDKVIIQNHEYAFCLEAAR